MTKPGSIPEPARVLYIHPGVGIGGAQVNLSRVVGKLDQRRFEPFVLCSPGSYLERHATGARILTLNLPPWRKARGWPFLFPCLLGIRGMIRRHCINLVIANDFWYSPLAVLAGRLAGVPSIVHVQDSIITPAKGRQYLLSLATAVVCASDSIRRRVVHLGGLARKTVTIYNGLDLDKFHPAVQPNGFRRDIHVADDDILIGTVGNICEEKGQVHLLEAARTIIKENRRVRFVLVGESKNGYRDYLQRICDRWGFNGNVIFCGPREDMPEVLAALDIVVTTSWRESFSLVVGEAMAMGKPLVYTNVGGVPELVGTSSGGIAVSPGSCEQLVAAIQTLIQDPEHAREMGRAGRRHVEQNFSLEKHVTMMEALYEQVLYLGKNFSV